MQTPYAIGQRGAVAAAHPLAVDAGLAMLRAGGNAMDAAIATAFALTVTDPGNASLGGRGSLVAYLPDDGRLLCLDFNTVCPRNAGPDTFEVVPTREGEWWSARDSANTIGRRAVSVPATAAGLCAAARYARLPLSTLVAPAAEIARAGFPVTVPLEMALAAARERVLPNAASRAIYAPAGRCLRRGETLANPDLARTLHKLGETGRELIYDAAGEVARALTRDMAEHGGLVDEGDLSSYETIEHQPATITYRGHELAVTPVSNGGPTVLAALRILEGFDLGNRDPYSPETVHLVIEALKLAWADRFAYLSDPAFAPVPIGGLLTEEYAAVRRARIDLDSADPAPAPGDPWPFDNSASRREWSEDPRHPDVGGDTTYCCTADSFGGFVSLTHTLGSSFGSGVTVPGTGVLLNNGMYWFDPTPGRVNSVAPGKVPLNNQAETLVLEGGRPWLAIGLPGGRRILTTLTRALGLILDHGLSPAAALAAPRLHVEDREPVTFESAWRTDVPGGVDLLLDLQALGHGLTALPILERFISGPAHAVWSESGQLHAAGDPRQPGAAGAL